MVGQTFGHYRILEKIGAGGMGEVYRASDTRLGRDVAVKVLPAGFAQNPERLARFEREAQLLASLNHPNIAAIHGLEESNGIRFLVLEFVPGETLAEKLNAGPLPVDDALHVCRQIAEALEAAHEKGIVHRDLKPSNVKVTAEGKVKVLDFGLAKAFSVEASSVDPSHSPTVTSGGTQAGVILGTAAYMSPEQARGRPVDRRADIWSFGCVLFEALTARQAFSGETVSDTISAILRGEPEWNALPPGLPSNVLTLLHRCLQKDAARRLRDIGDARLEIDEVFGGAVAAPAVTPAQPARPLSPARAWMPWAVALAGVLLTGASVWFLKPAPQLPARPLARFEVALPPKEALSPGSQGRPVVALSQDGTRIAYLSEKDGETRIYLRPIDRLEAIPVPGTEGASNPFFSPDGQWVGFFANGKLKKVSIQGGTVVTVCDAPESRGASWGEGDFIILSPKFTSGLVRVSASGGTPQVLTTPDTGKGERTHRWPEVLPGGKAVLFVIAMAKSPDYYFDATIAVQSLETGERKVLINGGTNPRYASSGHIVYASVGGLFAVPFDLARLELTGPPVPVIEAAEATVDTGAAHFALSRTGSIVYLPGSPLQADRKLIWVDRRGEIQPLPAPSRAYREPQLSPDGTRLAVTIGSGRNEDVWVYEMERGTLTRLTFEGSKNTAPIWSPDGKKIVYGSERRGTNNLLMKASDGGGQEELLLSSDQVLLPGSWSPDGKLLVYTAMHPQNQGEIWILPLEGDRKPRPFVTGTVFDEGNPRFSPDGRWLAYASDEGGRYEVYVQPYPGPGGKWQISTEGGDYPSWNRNGKELFYVNGSNIMSVAVTPQISFTAGKPQRLFQLSAREFQKVSGLNNALYDDSPDGRRFVLVQGSEQASHTKLNVVLEWVPELKRLAPSGKK